MKIAASEISFAAAHTARSSLESSLQITVIRPSVAASDTVSLSSSTTDAGQAVCMNEASLPPNLALLKCLIERLTGREIHIGLMPGQAAQASVAEQVPPAATQAVSGGAVEIQYSEHREESEQLSVEAGGWVQTSDGQRIAFKLSLSLSRQFVQDLQLDVSTGEMVARKKDPLVIDFNGTAAELGSGRFDFDLDKDGRLDAVPTLGGGSSYLVLDKNGDGQINDGGELFGALSGDGFSDLSAHDQDRNGWIDENDAVYGKLGVWQPDASGAGDVQKLAAADVGAISLARVASAFEYRDGANTPLASLKDSGSAGTVQQLDLFV